MKFAIELIETLTRTVIVEAEDINEAYNKIKNAYYKEEIQLHADNSNIELELKDDTDNYKEIFGDEFDNLGENYEE